MEDEDMAYRIAEVLNENAIDARRAEPMAAAFKRIPSIEEKRWDFNTRHCKYN